MSSTSGSFSTRPLSPARSDSGPFWTLDLDEIQGEEAPFRAIISKTVANGCTEGEALAAIAKAHELVAAYDISEADLGATKPQEGANIFAADANDPYGIKRGLASGVAEFTKLVAGASVTAAFRFVA